jgi:hypothetical protein
VVAAFAIFYLSTAFALSHMTAERGAERETVLALQLAANLFLALGIIVAGWAPTASGPRWMLACGSVGHDRAWPGVRTGAGRSARSRWCSSRWRRACW